MYQPTLANGAKFPDFPGLSPKWDRSAEYLTVFPNVLFGVHRDHCFAIMLEPKAVDRTVEHVAIYYSRPEVTGPEFGALRTRNAELVGSAPPGANADLKPPPAPPPTATEAP